MSLDHLESLTGGVFTNGRVVTRYLENELVLYRVYSGGSLWEDPRYLECQGASAAEEARARGAAEVREAWVASALLVVVCLYFAVFLVILMACKFGRVYW